MSLPSITIDDPEILQFFASYPYINPNTFIKSKLNFTIPVSCENTFNSTAINDTDIRQIYQDVLAIKEAHEKLVENHKTSLKVLSSIERIEQICNGKKETLHEKFPCEYCGKPFDTKKSTAMHRRACKNKPSEQLDADDLNEGRKDEDIKVQSGQENNQDEEL